MTDLAVIIVSWNVRAQVLDALRSLYDDLAGTRLAAQVLLVDNASTDGTVEAVAAAFPQTRILTPGENLGFVRGNNLALRTLGFGVQPAPALPEAVYLLNPDTITQPGATAALFEVVTATNGPGLAGARLAYEDGSFQHSAFAFPGLRQLWAELFPTPGRLLEGRFNGRYPRALYEAGQPFAVDFVLGATMMLRADVVQAAGMFDEAFFMYCEEIDWAYRIHAAGWGVQCVPAARVVHLSAQSTGQARPQNIVRLWESRLHLFGKHWPRWKRTIGRRLIIAGMQRRLANEADADVRAAYRTVIQLASQP